MCNICMYYSKCKNAQYLDYKWFRYNIEKVLKMMSEYMNTREIVLTRHSWFNYVSCVSTASFNLGWFCFDLCVTRVV